jgi:hypothetical protein
MSATAQKWVLLDETNGAACANGETMTPSAMAHIAEAMSLQLNGEFADEWGGGVVVRVGSSPTDIQPGEVVYSFQPTLPQAPGASAYHDVNGQGVPFAFCAVTTCDSLLGPNGCGVDASHEGCEAQGDPGCNLMADDNAGKLHAIEACDAVEVQQYPVLCADGTAVYVSNFLTKAWFIPGAPMPYDFMCKAGLPGAVSPPGPLQTAPSPDGQGNYQIEEPSLQAQATQVFGKGASGASHRRVVGSPRRPEKAAHWSSRTSRRLGASSRP